MTNRELLIACVSRFEDKYTQEERAEMKRSQQEKRKKRGAA